VRKEALDEIGRLVASDPRVVFIGSDLGAGVMADAMEQFPDRVLMEGIAEQHLVGMASAMALEGFIPYVHTIGTFLTRRALEQVIIDAALHKLPVRLIASGGGMVYAPLGPTHQAIDDLALMRAVDGMAVLSPIDPREMEETMTALADWPGPAYVRLGKGGEPVVTEPGFSIGPLRHLAAGTDLLVLTTGAVGHEALSATTEVNESGYSVSLVHIPTISPLDENSVLELIAHHPKTIVIEEHMPRGGLWTAIVESAMRHRVRCDLHQASLPPGYAQRYGSQMDHWRDCGLSKDRLVSRFKELVGGPSHG